MKKFGAVKLAVGSLIVAGSLTAGAIPVANMALNPQPLPPGHSVHVALNPQPLPPQKLVHILAFNPQPDPPGRA